MTRRANLQYLFPRARPWTSKHYNNILNLAGKICLSLVNSPSRYYACQTSPLGKAAPVCRCSTKRASCILHRPPKFSAPCLPHTPFLLDAILSFKGSFIRSAAPTLRLMTMLSLYWYQNALRPARANTILPDRLLSHLISTQIRGFSKSLALISLRLTGKHAPRCNGARDRPCGGFVAS